MLRRKEFRIAIAFITGLVLLYWGINFLKGKNVFNNQVVLYADYDHVAGMVPASPVVVNGFKIGQVSDISFIPGQNGKLRIKMLIDEKLDIPENSVARIESSDLLGSKAVVIHLGQSNSMAGSGDFLKGELEMDLKEEVSMQILPLKNKAEDLLSSFDTVLIILKTIFNEKTQDNLSRSFESIRKTIVSLEHASSNLDTLMSSQKYKLSNIFSNVESITQNLKNNNEKINSIIENVSQLSDSASSAKIKQTVDKAHQSLEQFYLVMEKINTGQGSMGMLIHNDSLYNNLNNSALELNLLLEDMRINPKRYVQFSIFGSKGGKKNSYKPR